MKPAQKSGPSLHGRILGAALLLLGALAGITGLGSWRHAERAAQEAFDHLLAAAALTIADTVQIERGEVTVDLPHAALAILGRVRTTRVFWRVSDPGNAFLTGYADLGFELPQASSATPEFHDSQWRGTDLRLIRVGRWVSSPEISGWTTIMMGETLEARKALSSEIFRNAFLSSMGIAGLGLILIFVGLRRAFAPFAALRAELEDRAPGDLAPVATSVPRELEPMVSALDAFMNRLRANQDRMRKLAADAAHQVRTPLASLRAQAELAVDEQDPERIRDRVARIHANAVGASQIVNQLLSEATVAHRRETTRPRAVDLRAICLEILSQLDPEDAGRIRLHVEIAEEPAMVRGDALAMREMMRNLIDNALRHAPGSPVEIRFDQTDAGIGLRVMDRGPGIPAGEHGLVLERFGRGSTAAPGGSGLGLAIVQSVVQGSGGRLMLSDRPGGGLIVEILWGISTVTDA